MNGAAAERANVTGVAAERALPRISIVMPVLNEAQAIQASLAALQPLRAAGHEAIVVDGGSSDGTADLAAALADRIVSAPRGRAAQMNAGAAIATGDILLFLHADTRLPERADAAIIDALRTGRVWGRFDVRIDSSRSLLAVVGTMMNSRSRATGICTGDQCIFIAADAFAAIGGFPQLALMEDIALSRALRRRFGWPMALRERVTTSARRWEQHGVLRTILLMWWLRLRYFLGTPAERLAKAYAQR
jgi:rSAM/selenodomain-associated transferase 2